MPGPAANPLSVFRYTVFRNIWTATLVSNLGALIQIVGAGWMMTMISDNRSMVALVQTSSTLPIMLFSLVAGALADSHNKRRLMLTAQLFMLTVSILLTALAWMGLLTPWLLLAFSFLIGCGMALNNPAWQASLGDIVPRSDIGSAVALNSVGFNVMRSVGPAIGGAVVAAAGAAAAFALNALSYVPLIFTLLRWRPVYPEERLPRESVGSAINAGLRYVAMSPNIMRVIARSFAFGIAAIVVLALLPVITRDMLQGTALTYGIMLGCFGLGAIGGAMINPRLQAAYRNETIVRGAFAGFALGVAVLSISYNAWLSGAALLICGACWVLALSLFNVTVQLATPRWVVARALALYQTATFGGMTVGSWIWGELADAYHPETSLMVAAAVLICGALMGQIWALPATSGQNVDPLNRFREPELRLDLKMRSGPIMITVQYTIAQDDVDDFLAAMTERRRIRIRDGARHWVLLRDLENPDIWFESYHVPTWLEYLRHNQRRTQADAEITDRLQSLNRDGAPPVVQRLIERQTVPVHEDIPLKKMQTLH